MVLPSSCAFNSCVSKEATSITVLVTGSILCTSSMTLRCESIFCLTEGANHPYFLDAPRLSNLGSRYLKLFLLVLLFSLRVDKSSTISLRSSTSEQYSSFF